MKSIFFVVTLLIGIAVRAQELPKNTFNLLVGTYTTGKSEGIYVYEFDTNTGNFRLKNIAKGLKNPSFLSISPDGKNVYSVGETDKNGLVYAFSFDKNTGQLTLLNTQSAEGNYPCHISIDKTGRTVLVGNYGGGNVAVFRTQKNGSLAKAHQTFTHEGKGPNTDRQEAPHVHSVNIAPNNQDIFVPDLGIDQVLTYKLDAQKGTLQKGSPATTKLQDGSGPRHFTIHPKGVYAYVIQELTGQITVFSYKNRTLKALQTVSTLPEGYAGSFSCADIHTSPDGRFLYGSNRGHDSLVIFEIDPNTGMLTYVGHQSVLGKKPRNFMIDPTGQWVLVANQDSDNITIFKRDLAKGTLTPTGKEIAVPSPVCLKMMK
jgi:6-phosphogluconolactonase